MSSQRRFDAQSLFWQGSIPQPVWYGHHNAHAAEIVGAAKLLQLGLQIRRHFLLQSSNGVQVSAIFPA